MGQTIRRLYLQIKPTFGARALIVAVGVTGVIAVACSTSSVPESEPVARDVFQPGAVEVKPTPTQTPPPTAEVGRSQAPATLGGATPPPSPLPSVSRGESAEGPIPATARLFGIQDAPPPGLGTAEPLPTSVAEEAPKIDSNTVAPSPVAQAADPISSTFRELNPTGPKEINGSRFNQLLPRDAITPVYEPEYASAGSVDLNAQDLVMGVSIGGEHRAYPLRTLRAHEMVNDQLGGAPILVTW
tara:strand:- start:2926 stop:3654 length:729 start_codon:yes stop_codon:yes gene_type:complete